MVFIPIKRDEEALFDAYFRGTNKSYNPRRLRKIRAGYKQRAKATKFIKGVIVSEKFHEWAKRRRIIHYELPIYERLILGYNIMKRPPNQQGMLECKIDRTLLKMLQNQYKWRLVLKKDLRENMIIQRLLEEGEMKVADLFLQMADLGLELDAARSVIDKMMKRNLLFITEEGKIKVNIGEKDAEKETT